MLQLYPHVISYGKVDSTTNTLKFRLSRPCGAGQECFLSYGNFSSSHLVTFYGFVPKGDNPYDIIPLGECTPTIYLDLLTDFFEDPPTWQSCYIG